MSYKRKATKCYSQGRVVFSTDSHLEGTTDPVYGTKTLYDTQGRSVGSERYTGSRVAIAEDGTSTIAAYGTLLYATSTVYDTRGRVSSSTDAYGNTTSYEYDKLDRQAAEPASVFGLKFISLSTPRRQRSCRVETPRMNTRTLISP